MLTPMRGAKCKALLRGPPGWILRYIYINIHLPLQERERLKKKWPPSPHDDTATCEKWLAVHEKWVLEGSNPASEDEIYPLPYDPVKVRATVSEPLASRDDTSEHCGVNRTVEPGLDSSRDIHSSTTPNVSSVTTTADTAGTSCRRNCEEMLDPIDKALLDDLFDSS